MNHLRYLFVIFFIGLFGCSTSEEITFGGAQPDREHGGRRAEMILSGSSIHLIDGRVLEVDSIRLVNDTVRYLISGTDHGIPVDSVDHITGTNRFLGGLKGLGMGMGIGGGIAITAGAIFGKDARGDMPTWVSASIYGVMLGAPVGLVVGVIAGHEYRTTFKRSP